MMTPDEILAAHAARPPSRFSDADAKPKEPPPWWEVDVSIGGDLRAFLRNDKGKTEGEKEDGHEES